MRNLLRFFVRYNFPILFLVFEIIALTLIFSSNPIQGGYFADRFNSMSSVIYNGSYKLTQYLNLQKTNDQLARENSRLRNLEQMQVPDTVAKGRDFEFVSANVINNSIHTAFNYLTLDVGSSDQVAVDMGVISPEGIVGVVKSVSPNFCRVISVLNSQLLVSVRLKSSAYFGSMNWTGENYREVMISEIPSHAAINPGDTIVTSGYSAIFPPDEPVAVVLSSRPTSGGNFLEIKALLMNDFKRLSKVYVVKNLVLDEIKSIEGGGNEQDLD